MRGSRLVRNYWDTLKQRDALPPVDTSAYTRLSLSEVSKFTKPPGSVKMLPKTFIHDSLYNPNYGYFAKNVSILSPLKDIQFNSVRNTVGFSSIVSELYAEEEAQSTSEMPQIWHTPTELFKPWYGYSITDYLLKQYDANPSAYPVFVVYEIGAGNGTLMKNVLDYLAQTRPDVYSITEYIIIEISSNLAATQNKNLAASIKSHESKVKLLNASILDWNTLEERPCFFLAMEVIDNFSHDLIRYDYATNACLQAVVSIDESGDYQEEYEVATDPDIIDYLSFQTKIGAENPLLEADGTAKKSLLSIISPLSSNMTESHFIPTNTLKLFRILKEYFPRHQLCLTDFSSLPKSIDGINAPVVQTRYKGNMIPCSTYLVQPGWFDIFFPTDFEVLKKTYDHVMDTPCDRSCIRTHRQFLTEHSKHLKSTETKNGENPMLEYFQNVAFFLSNK